MSFPSQYIKRKQPPAQKPPQQKIKQVAERRTALFLPDMRNIDKQILAIITDFGNRTKAFKFKDLWARYFVCLYLSGARRNELFMLNPTISKFASKSGKMYYRIRRINEKHFEGRNPRRVVLQQTFKSWNEYETALFEFLLNNNAEITLDFKPLLDTSGKHPEKLKTFKPQYNKGDVVLRDLGSNFTFRFANLFRADMMDKENNKRIKEGIVPHQIRHWRVYNLKVEKNIPDGLVQKLMGWDDNMMLYYYADVKRSIQEKEAVSIYESMETNN